MAITFLQLAKKVLSEENRPLSATEICKIAVDKGQDSLVGSTGKTPWASLCALLYVDVRDKEVLIKVFSENITPIHLDVDLLN